MRKPAQFACNVCGVDKKDSNHWFVIHTRNDARESARITILRWTADERDYVDALHLCGQQCLGKKVAELSEAFYK